VGLFGVKISLSSKCLSPVRVLAHKLPSVSWITWKVMSNLRECAELVQFRLPVFLRKINFGLTETIWEVRHLFFIFPVFVYIIVTHHPPSLKCSEAGWML
jgi:hypothetical protein